jgi:hypothetical protein
MIQHRFKMINEALSSDHNFLHIYDIVSLHKSLDQVIMEVGGIFSLQLLVWISVTSVTLVQDSYLTSFTFCKRMVFKHYKIIVRLINNIAMYVFDLFYLSKRVTDLCGEVKLQIHQI